MPSAKLFTNLDRIVESDTFSLRILDEILTYEVDQIRVVEPKDTKELQIIKNEDLCTLVTCTPYGINSHRLLVRGHRIKTQNVGTRVTADALKLDSTIVAPFFASPILVILLISLFVRYRKRK